MAKYSPFPVEFEADTPYCEVRQGVGQNINDDVLYLPPDPSKDGYLDTEVNSQEPRITVPPAPVKPGAPRPS